MNIEHQIAAVIITYNPNRLLLCNNVKAIFKQVAKVVIVDNCSEDKGFVEELSFTDIDFVFQEENVGIAKALNVGIEKLENEGVDWVLTLDQDSICPSNLIESYKHYIEENNIAVICPNIDYSGDVRKATKEMEYVSACMTSASLTSVRAWRDIGGFDESFFIDYVDNDFCKRLTDSGYRIIQDNEVVLRHQLGDSKYVFFFFEKKLFGEHAPTRTYYMVRNNLFYIKKYRSSISLTKEILKFLFIVIQIIVYSSNKRSHIARINDALVDFSKGRMGKYNRN